MACRWATDIRADTENAESKLLTGAGPGVFDGVCPRITTRAGRLRARAAGRGRRVFIWRAPFRDHSLPISCPNVRERARGGERCGASTT